MAKLTRKGFVARIGAFRPEYASLFLIDNVKLSFSARSDVTRARILSAELAQSPSALANTAQLGLGRSVPMSMGRGPNGPALCWRDRSEIFQQGLRGGRFDRTLVSDFNPIRIVRDALPVEQRRQHARVPDNYLDPRVVPRRDAHDQCLMVLDERVREHTDDYCAIVRCLWGIELTPPEVLVSVNVIELAWDAVAPGQASLTASLFWDAWKRSFRGGRQVFDLKRLEFHADGMLKALGEADEILKLYAKSEDLVRFEAQLTKATAKKILGRRLDPTDSGAFRRGLSVTANEIYKCLVEVQALAVQPQAPNPLLAASGIGANPAARFVLVQLLQFGLVKVHGQAEYKALRDLRARGLVRIGLGKGNWSLTDDAAEAFSVVGRYFENQARWRAEYDLSKDGCDASPHCEAI